MMTKQVIGYLHEITEPNGGYWRMYSQFEANPWSHWTETHYAKCEYKRTPLVALQDEPSGDPEPAPNGATSKMCDDGHPPVRYWADECPACEIRELATGNP